MKQLLLFGILSLSQIMFAQKGQAKRIVQIKGNDTTVIIINGQMDEMDSILTEEMKMIYNSDSMFTRVDVFMDSTFILEDDQLHMDSIKVKIGNMKIVILDDGNGEMKREKRMIIDERVIIQEDDEDETFDMGSDDGSSTSNNPVWSGFGLSANGFLNTQNQLASGSELGFFELDPARSIGVQLNVVEKRFPIIKDYL